MIRSLHLLKFVKSHTELTQSHLRFVSNKRPPAHRALSQNIENKQLFGHLLETKAEKVKRVKKLVAQEAGPGRTKFPRRKLKSTSEQSSIVINDKTVRNKTEQSELQWLGKSELKVLKISVSSEVGSVADLETEIKGIPISLPYVQSGPARLPSVTKILSATMSPESKAILEKWEKNMIKKLGEEGIREYKEALFFDGKELHANIRDSLTGTPESDLKMGEGSEGHWRSLRHVVLDMQKVHVVESFVTHPRLQYCGIVDCVGVYKDKLVLIDWKTAEKPKPVVTMTYDAPLQIAAYIGAMKVDPSYKKKIKDGLIVVGYKSGQRGETFYLSETDIAMYWKQWNARLKLYRQQQQQLEKESELKILPDVIVEPT